MTEKNELPYWLARGLGLLNQLATAGLKKGRYLLREIKGGWMGVPEK